MTQPEVEAAIAALEQTLALGQLRVDFADRSVTYRSTADLKDAIDHFKLLLAAMTGETRPKQTQVMGSKGLGSC